MKFRNLFFLIFLILLYGCNELDLNKSSKRSFKPEKKYKNIGFSLIYSDDLNLKKLENRSLFIFHKSLKSKSFVKISNPLNGKSLIAEVKSNRVKFSNFYNSIISKRIAEDLELDFNEPYLEILLISNKNTFVAKKTKTFDEEKQVAEKAPIDGIQINDLNKNTKKKKKINKDTFSYSIKVADFYYKDTAQIMIDRIKKETSIKNLVIIRLTQTKYRVLIGPFDDIKSLKNSFEKMKPFNFENLEILRNV